MQEPSRSSTAALVLVSLLISMLAWVSAVAFWADRSVGGETAFRAHAHEVVLMETSQEALSTRLMDEAIEALPLLALVRGAGERAIVVLIGSGAFDPALDRLIAEGHRHMLSGSDEPFVADLTDVRAVIVAPIAEIAPEFADEIPVDIFEAVVILDSDALPLVGRAAGWLPVVTVLAAAVAVFLAVATVMLSRRRPVALLAVGLGVLFAGAGVAAWSMFGGSIASWRIEDDLTRVLVANGYVVISPALKAEGIGLMTAGAVVALAGLIGTLATRRK
ncbi:MAG: hypothetical protein ABFS21_05705 [Actinomycetota bacterium]